MSDDEDDRMGISSMLQSYRRYREIVQRQRHRMAAEAELGTDGNVQFEPITDADKFHNREPIRLTVVSCDGGEYSPRYTVNNLVQPSGVYCSDRTRNVSVLLTCDTDVPALFTSFLLVSPPAQTYTCPVAAALIFVLDEQPDISTFQRWNGATEEQWKAFKAKKDKTQSWTHTDPCAFLNLDHFEMTHPLVARCILDKPRSGRYVLVKLLRSFARDAANEPDNIDVQFFGALGHTKPTTTAAATIL